jgi:hypothetical protein
MKMVCGVVGGYSSEQQTPNIEYMQVAMGINDDNI